MLKKIYGILEYFHIQESWPQYEEFYIGSESQHDYLVLETITKNQKRKAYIYYKNDTLEELASGKKVTTIELVIPYAYPRRWFVNKYCLTREDGGPEEGGWSWDCHTPTKSTLCADEECANLLKERMDMDIDHEAQEKEPYYNVNSPGHDYVAVENHPPINPKRPHYE